MTVPNIMKVMNPKLVGFSTGDGWFLSRTSQFNMAFVGAMDQDLLLQARKLLARMKNDRRVDFENHWKVGKIKVNMYTIKQKFEKFFLHFFLYFFLRFFFLVISTTKKSIFFS